MLPESIVCWLVLRTQDKYMRGAAAWLPQLDTGVGFLSDHSNWIVHSVRYLLHTQQGRKKIKISEATLEADIKWSGWLGHEWAINWKKRKGLGRYIRCVAKPVKQKDFSNQIIN